MGLVNRVTTDLGKIREDVRSETSQELRKRFEKNDPGLFLFLPATYSHLTGPAMRERIIPALRELQEERLLGRVVIGLDGASEEEWQDTKRMDIDSLLIWNDDPTMQELYRAVGEQYRQGELKPGKGRNVWTGLGIYDLLGTGAVWVTHDCDIKTYTPSLILDLVSPIINPFWFSAYNVSKAYYERVREVNGKRVMGGRVRRLLIAPLLEALEEVHPRAQGYLHHLEAFRYPLSGEFAADPQETRRLRIQPDWGLEMSLLNYFYQSNMNIAQVNLGEYDHDHQPESYEDKGAGLNRMAIEVSKTILRELVKQRIPLEEITDEWNRKRLIFQFYRNGNRIIGQNRDVMKNRGFAYDEVEERGRLSLFASAIEEADTIIQQNPRTLSPLPD